MSLLDLLVVIVVGASVVAGFMAGFARVGIGFLAAILGVLFGFWFYGIPAGWVHHYCIPSTAVEPDRLLAGVLGDPDGRRAVRQSASKLFKWTGLSWLDRLLGGAFGLVRGALIAVVMIAVLLAFTPKPLPNWMVKSQVLPYAIDASNAIAALAPERHQERLPRKHAASCAAVGRAVEREPRRTAGRWSAMAAGQVRRTRRKTK